MTTTILLVFFLRHGEVYTVHWTECRRTRYRPI